MITFIKNQSPFIVAFLILAVIALIMLTPLEDLLSNIIVDDFRLEYASLTIKMGLLFLLAYFLIPMLKIKTLAGLSRSYPWRFGYLNFIPVYLIIIGILSLLPRDFSQIDPTNVMLLLLACLMVGFAEEFIFRGLLQPLFLKKYGLSKNGILLSILIAAVFFGTFHLLNLTKNDNVGQVLVQVVFAMFIGFFFGVLVLRTNKLIPIAITHGLINFSFSLALLPGLKTVQDSLDETVSVAPIVLTLPLFIIGLLIYRKLDQKEVIEKLDIPI